MLHTKIEIRVRYAETDMMGIAYHGNYVTWFEMARIQMMDEFGYPYREMERDGYRLPVLEVGIRFKRSVTFDDRITVEATLSEKPGLRFRITYRLFLAGREAADGFSVHAFLNHDGRPVRPPKRFVAGVQAAFG